MPPSQVFIFIIGTVIILFGAYYVTYFIGMKASGQTRAGLRNRNITVLDRYSIARDKGFYVVKAADKVYVIGVTTGAMTLLDTYTAAEFEELTKAEEGDTPVSWADTPVGRYGNKLTQKVVAFVAARTGKGPRDAKDSKKSSESEKPGNSKESESIHSGETTFEESMNRAQENADKNETEDC